MNEMNWDDLRLFLAVARGGGLATAAKTTGKSAPTLGRRMLALERRLGQELFHRLPRGYELTEDGRHLLQQLEAVETGIAPLARTAGRERPLVKISAGTWMTQLLCRHADRIADEAVSLRFIAADHVLDIARREAVIGIRNHRPEQVGLACRRIGRVRFGVFAQGDGVKCWARVRGETPSARWLADHLGDAPVIEVTHPRNALDLAEAGVARAVLPVMIGATRPGLQMLGSPIAALEHDQWLVSHHEDRFAPPVRRVIDRIHQVLKEARYAG